MSVTNTLAANLPVSVTLQFDANGNLTNDATKSLSYDVENQLTNVTVAGQWREDFLYDGFNRRRITRQYLWDAGTSGWALTNETRFIYDGNVVIQEWSSNNLAQVSYTRGSDLSGLLQGAGGIGGLLARTDTNGSVLYHAAGNGNVTSLINTNQYIVARYLYDPYGRLLGKWGTLADANVYRFSSKEYDPKAGLYYFKNRFYDSNLQHWLSRDPFGETGGINLYQFVGNNPINYIDPLGLLIELYGGATVGSFRHSFIKLTPDNPSDFPNVPMQTGPDGKQFFTIEGEPGWVDWYLNKDQNNKSDVAGIMGDYAKNLGAIKRGKCSDTDLIKDFLNSYNNYQNSSLWYSAKPGGTQYNSNGFSHGIINSVGATSPDLSDDGRYVGWGNPVPNSAFQPKSK